MMASAGLRVAALLATAALAAGARGQTTPAPPAKPAASAPTADKAARAKASLEPLLQQGSDALAAGQYKAAHDAFADALALDPRNVKAHHGIAMCLVAEKQIARAAALFDKAVGMTPTPDRALVINAAAVNMAIRSHMRAAKIAKDYLGAHAGEPDEPVLNALGTALSAATGTERKNRFFGECASFYMIANLNLEKTRPGQKRFGSEWFPAAEADAKAAQMAANQRKLDALSEKVGAAEDKVDAAQKEFAKQQYLVSRGLPANNFQMGMARVGLESAMAKQQAAYDEYDALAATLAQPKFPIEIRMVAMDDVKPVAVAVASASDPAPVVAARPPRAPRVTEPPKPTDPAPGTGTAVAMAPAAPPPIAIEPPKPKAARKVRITQYAAAFPVAADLVVTSAAAVEDGAAIQLQSADGQGMTGTLVRRDEKSGLALVRIGGGDRKLRGLALADAFAGGAVTCASFPTVDLFSPAAQSVGGTATAPKDGWTVSLNLHPRLAGSPVIAGGKVVGVCVAPRDADRAKLPAATLDQLKAFVGADADPAKVAGDPAASLLQVVTTRETGGE